MTTMKQAVIFALVLLLGACAVPPPTASGQVFQKAITNQGPGLTTSPELFNQGQAQHLIAILLQDNVLTCFPAGTVISIQGSFDGTTWQNIGETFEPSGTPLASVTGLFLRRAEGYFPRVRVSSSLAGADCLVNIWYSGTQQTVSPKYEPDANAGGLQWYCQTGVTTADTQFIIVPAQASGSMIVIHSVFVYSDTIRVFDLGYNAPGPTWAPLLGTLTLPDDGHLVMPPAVTPYFTVPSGAVDGFKIRLFAGASPVTACASARYAVVP